MPEPLTLVELLPGLPPPAEPGQQAFPKGNLFASKVEQVAIRKDRLRLRMELVLGVCEEDMQIDPE